MKDIENVKEAFDKIIVASDVEMFHENIDNFEIIDQYIYDSDRSKERMKHIARSLAEAIITGGKEQAIECFDAEGISDNDLEDLGIDLVKLNEKEDILKEENENILSM